MEKPNFALLYVAAKNGNIAEINRLIADGVDVNTRAAKGETPLHFAVHFAQTETACALIKKGAHIEEKSDGGWTPLHLASVFGKTETAHALIKEGADIEAKANNGWTPLHLAAKEGQTETVIALVKAGADYLARDNNGMTPLQRGWQSPLPPAIFARSDGWTPLHVAVWEGQIQTVRTLAKKGTDLRARDNDGKTPLDIAIAFHGEDSEIARILREAMEKQGG